MGAKFEEKPISLHKVYYRRLVEFPFEDVEHPSLLLSDLISAEFAFADHLTNLVDGMGVDSLKFVSNEDAGEASDVEGLRLEALGFLLEVSVHDAHGVEESSSLKLQATADLNHPIDHQRSLIFQDFVIHQAVTYHWLVFAKGGFHIRSISAVHQMFDYVLVVLQEAF